MLSATQTPPSTPQSGKFGILSPRRRRSSTRPLATMQETFDSSHIAATGYCFGGRFVARYLAAGRSLEAGSATRPSGTTADEWDAISLPINLAFGQLAQSNAPENRSDIDAVSSKSTKTFQTSLYLKAEHGFAVRTNPSIPQEALAQEAASWQAMRWFDA